MPIIVKRTGLDQYAPGGTARLKVMVIGGPSVGKTRWSSFFPDPIFLDIEGGLASVADREVPYAQINTTRDMNDALQHLKFECRKPEDQRQYKTVVVDTLDAWQRKLKTEWMETKRVDSFTGWEAWGFLSQNMQSLMTRLLNLDMNVVVAVHYKDKTTRDDDTGRETHEYMLQLSGEIADTAFNDFDFVGWMEEDRRVVDGKPQLVRFITFDKTTQRPFLKDRLNVMDGEIPVTFSDDDYKQLMSRITSRMDGLSPSVDVGEIPDYSTAPTENVVAPDAVAPSVLPKREPALETLDKAQLQQIAKNEGVTKAVDGKPLRGNSLKSELVEAIKWARSKPASAPITPPATPPAPAAVPYREQPQAETVNLPQTPAPAEPPAPPAPAAPAAPARPQPSINTPMGKVNPTTGEILAPEAQLQKLSKEYANALATEDPQKIAQAENALESFDDGSGYQGQVSEEAAKALIADKLGGKVVARSEERVRIPTAQPAPPTQAPPAQAHKYADKNCQMCNKSLAHEPFQPIQLGWIKFRQLLCEEHFIERRDAAKK